MAAANQTPVANPARGIESFARDLAVVLAGKALDDLSWARPDDLTLFIPMQSRAADLFLLRLQFQFYPEWPPSAIFVNPLTRNYVIGADAVWLPKINAPHLQVHQNYAGKDRQLICNSSTVEFYELGHSVEQRHVWNEQTSNFALTIHTINSALRGEHYGGRQS